MASADFGTFFEHFDNLKQCKLIYLLILKTKENGAQSLY